MDENELKELVDAGLTIGEIANLHDCSYDKVSYWLRKYNLRAIDLRVKEREIKKDKIKKLLPTATCKADILRGMGLTLSNSYYKELKILLKEMEIDENSIKNSFRPKIFPSKVNSAEALVQDSKNSNSTIKKILIREFGMGKSCQGDLCDITDQWLGDSITLQLDHINGDNTDNRIENLRFLCPNCHSQTKTFSKGSAGPKRKINKCKNCQIEVSQGSARCKPCSYKNMKVEGTLRGHAKIDWPCSCELLESTNATSFVQVGKNLTVSDNAVRKRIKNYPCKCK